MFGLVHEAFLLHSVVANSILYLWRHAALIAACAIIVEIIRTRYKKGLRQVPGPFIASISSMWRLFFIWKQDLPAVQVRLHERYGGLVRIGPNHISLSDPEDIKVVYGTKSQFTKVGLLLQAFLHWYMTIILLDSFL